jgi:hypothetical protein
MGTNVIFSALYALGMRRVIKKTNFDNWDGACIGLVGEASSLTAR